MRILTVHNKYRFRGGEERSVALQVALLEQMGHEVVSYTRDSQNIPLMSPAEKLWTAIETPYSWRVYREISSLIRRTRPAIMHVHNVFPLITPSAISAAVQAGIPIIYTHHNYRLSCASGLRYLEGEVCDRCTGGAFLPAVANRCVQAQFWPSLIYAVSIRLHRSMGTFADGISVHVCPSRAVARYLEKVLPIGSRIEIVHHFLPDEKASPRRSDRPYILYLGRISEEKGVQLLVQAAQHLIQFLDIEMLGDGPCREQLMESRASGELESVRFRGHVGDDSRFEFLAGALAVVVPSLSEETSSYAVLESFRAGVPVIAARSGALEELIEPETNGLLFARGSGDAMVAAIMRIYKDEDLWRRLSRGARDSYLQKYSSAAGYEALMGCYERALAMKAGHARSN